MAMNPNGQHDNNQDLYKQIDIHEPASSTYNTIQCKSSNINEHMHHHENATNETQPLLHQHSSHTPNHHVSNWRFWNSRSHSFRFFMLLLVTLMPMGPHILKYYLTSLASMLMSDDRLQLSYTELGSLQSAIGLPNLILPLMGGILLDVKGSKFGTILSFAVCLIGQILFTIACYIGSYRFSLVSRVLYGLGRGTTVVAQGRLAAHWFVGRELVFAVAMTEASHDVAQWLGFVIVITCVFTAKVYPVPVSEYFNSYIAALVAGCVFCGISMMLAIVYFYWIEGLVPHHQLTMDVHGEMHDHNVKQQKHDEKQELKKEQKAAATRRRQKRRQQQQQLADTASTDSSVVDDGSESDTGAMKYGDMSLTLEQATSLLDPRRFTVRFFLLCGLHLLFANCFHLFSYVSVIYMEQEYKYKAETAAWISSISSITGIFLCPVAGYFVDKIGYKMYICILAGIITAIAFIMLAAITAYWVPVVCMLLLSLCISFVPTVLRSSVPNLVHPALFGTAYGFYEISEAAGNVAGNALVGYIRDITGSYTLDLYMFACMGVIASILAVVLTATDKYKGGALNLPSHVDDPHHTNRQEGKIAEALSFGTGMPDDHQHDSYDITHPHSHHTHHDNKNAIYKQTPTHLHIEPIVQQGNYQHEIHESDTDGSSVTSYQSYQSTTTSSTDHVGIEVKYP